MRVLLILINGTMVVLMVDKFFGKTGNYDGNGRLSLWISSLEAIKESPFFGWGPGGHAGIDGPYGGWESHNTILDLGTAAGIFGLLFYLLIIVANFRKIGQYSPASLLLFVMIVYSMAHNVLRHPVFWLVLIDVWGITPIYLCQGFTRQLALSVARK